MGNRELVDTFWRGGRNVEHKNTPTGVCFHIQSHPLLTAWSAWMLKSNGRCTLNTKSHQRGCVFTFGVGLVPSSWRGCRNRMDNAHRTRNHINGDVCLCAACIRGCGKCTKDKNTPTVVCFHLWHGSPQYLYK